MYDKKIYILAINIEIAFIEFNWAGKIFALQLNDGSKNTCYYFKNVIIN